MNRSIIGYDNYIRRRTFRIPLLNMIIFLLFVIALSVIPAGCVDEETAKKINLTERVDDSEVYRAVGQDDTLWFGFDLRLDPKEEVKIYTPFLQYLKHSIGRPFKIKFTNEYSDTVDNLGEGITDFASLGTLSYVIGREKFGIKYLVSGVNREGDPRYHAAIVVPSESKIRSIRQLKGTSFCFGARMSTQGHLIPRKMMEDQGVTIRDLERYEYTGSHINAASAVLNRDCDAAGIQDTLANRLVYEGKIRILALSEPYPSSLIAYQGELDSKTVSDIRDALLSFEPTGRHRSLLYEWDKTEMPLGFTVIDESEINRVAELAKRYGLMRDAVTYEN